MKTSAQHTIKKIPLNDAVKDKNLLKSLRNLNITASGESSNSAFCDWIFRAENGINTKINCYFYYINDMPIAVSMVCGTSTAYFVDKEFRRQGIGSSLVKYILEDLKTDYLKFCSWSEPSRQFGLKNNLENVGYAAALEMYNW